LTETVKSQPVIDFSNENGIVAKNEWPLFCIPFSAMTFCRARFGCGGMANVVHNWFQITARRGFALIVRSSKA